MHLYVNTIEVVPFQATPLGEMEHDLEVPGRWGQRKKVDSHMHQPLHEGGGLGDLYLGMA